MSDNKKIFQQEYDQPNDRSRLVDIHEGKVLDNKDIPPMELIKALAKKYNWKISDPSSGCGKCYGRGYEGKLSDGSPVPCRCLFRHRTVNERKQDQVMAEAQVYDRKNRKSMLKFIHKKIMEAKKSNPNLIKEIKEEMISQMSADDMTHKYTSSAAEETDDGIKNIDIGN
jgi:hypothetical protein